VSLFLLWDEQDAAPPPSPPGDILQEDGTYILQEDGTKILTES
jgi:hypothetical protein